MYTVVGRVRSRAFRVMWALEEMGVPYTHIDAGPQSDEARKYHPTGKIPVMMVGDEALTDSVAIMSYLSDVHGTLGAPAGTIQRARLDAMLHYLNEDLDAPLWQIAKHTMILPEERRVEGAVATAKWEVERTFNALSDRVQGPWLMGKDFTIADVLAVHCLGWAFGLGIPVENADVKDYGKRARARAGFRQAGQQ
ncbi:glutathione S-transferase family protein [Aestuariivita sp.]|jgi:glutathione S-transferase|uniref:glutathione S-transferase family protein n=1 Tax=Aestuariivita sp. TaxID=1872407 RepID=UPI00216E4839|nr:glutathione S-transferase family protein [Aestuariivita sp.]MCE8007185.1 glutathione S-transferase family protein [Aestuariivita sp.]